MFITFFLLSLLQLCSCFTRYNKTIVMDTDYGTPICCNQSKSRCSTSFITKSIQTAKDFKCVGYDDEIVSSSIGCFTTKEYALKFGVAETEGSPNDYDCVCAGFSKFETQNYLKNPQESCDLTYYTYNTTSSELPDDYWMKDYYPCFKKETQPLVRSQDLSTCPLICEGYDQGLICQLDKPGVVKDFNDNVVYDHKSLTTQVMFTIKQDNPEYELILIFEDNSGSSCSVHVKHNGPDKCDGLTFWSMFYIGNWTCLSTFHKVLVVFLLSLSILTIAYSLIHLLPCFKKVAKVISFKLLFNKLKKWRSARYAEIDEEEVNLVNLKKNPNNKNDEFSKEELSVRSVSSESTSVRGNVNQLDDVEISNNKLLVEGAYKRILKWIMDYGLRSGIGKFTIKGTLDDYDDILTLIGRDYILRIDGLNKSVLHLDLGDMGKATTVTTENVDVKIKKIFAIKDEQASSLLSKMNSSILTILISLIFFMSHIPHVVAQCNTVTPAIGSGYSCISGTCTLTSAFNFKLFDNSTESCYEFFDDNDNLVYKLRLKLKNFVHRYSLKRLYYTYDHYAEQHTKSDTHSLSSKGYPYWMRSSGHCSEYHCEYKTFSVEAKSEHDSKTYYYLEPQHNEMYGVKRLIWKRLKGEGEDDWSTYIKAHICLLGIGEWWYSFGGSYDYYCFGRLVPKEWNLIEVFDLVPEPASGELDVFELVNGTEEHFTAKIGVGSTVMLKIGSITIQANDPSEFSMDDGFKIVYEHWENKWWYAPAANWNACVGSVLGESQYTSPDSQGADYKSMTCCWANVNYAYSKDQCSVVYTSPTWRLDPDLYQFPNVKIKGRQAYIEDAKTLNIKQKDLKGMEGIINIEGSFTLKAVTQIDHVTDFKFNCTSYVGGARFTKWNYMCESDTGTCVVRTSENNAMRIIELLTCDGLYHEFDGPTDSFTNIWCGDMEVIYSCEEHTIGEFTPTSIQVLYSHNDPALEEFMKSLSSIGTGLGGLLSGLGFNIGEKIASIIQTVLIIAAIILVAVMLVKILLNRIRRKKEEADMRKIDEN